MTTICYENRNYLSEDTDTVLDTLLKNGIDYPYSCKTGTCQSCLIKLLEGEVDSKSQNGLKPTLVQQNYFLACQCKANNDMKIARPNQDETSVSTKIIGLSKLNHNVLQVKLSTDNINNLNTFKAGQYINLVTEEKIIRSYSIANVPSQYIALHVKLMTNGLMSNWLSKQAKIGSSLQIRGPMGDCFYCNPGLESFPIVLAGTGTGLAPLIGIIDDALKSKHNGKITLIHGGVHETDLYLNKTLNQLQNTHSNFNYIPCALKESATIQQGSIDSVLVNTLNNIEKNVRLYICGPEETTKKMKMKAFMAGVPSRSIYSDTFITAS